MRYCSGAQRYRQSWRGFALPAVQRAVLVLLVGAGTVLILSTVQHGSVRTSLLYGCVAVGGLFFCRATQLRLGDPQLSWLGHCWLIKLSVLLFLLYVGWIPELLNVASYTQGYDPVRFYYQARGLIGDGWQSRVSLNYQGVLYYYAGVFYIFGHNPVAPALVNAFVTLLGTLYLIRVAYEFKRQRGRHDWMLAFVLLIPEILWFDVMTARETLTAVLVLVGAVAAGRYMVRSSPVSFNTTLVLTGGCLLAIFAVRPVMAIPVVGSIVLMALLLGSGRRSHALSRTAITGSAIALLAMLPAVHGVTGGYEREYVRRASGITSVGERATSSNVEWSEQSIGFLLVPHSLWQSIVYTPPRMVLYLVSPLPNIDISLADLLARHWTPWQRLMVTLSSALNIVAIPYVAAGSAYWLRRRRQYPAPSVLYITYWSTFIAIVAGNFVIHERYRIMATLLLAVCAWFGATTCTKRSIAQMSIAWYGTLACAAMFYLAYK